MSDKKTLQGSCVCGAVAYTAEDTAPVEACHCSTCKRWCGGPFVYVPARTVTFTQGTPATFTSSDWGERGFCATCGSNLYWRLTDPDYSMERPWDVTAGTLHNLPRGAVTREIFTDSAPALPTFCGDHEKLTGAEFRALTGQDA